MEVRRSTRAHRPAIRIGAAVACLAGLTFTAVAAAGPSPWSVVPTPNPGTHGGEFTASSAAPGTSKAWAVGYYMNSLSHQLVLIESNQSGSWSQATVTQPSTAQNILDDVSVVSPSLAWSVGYYAHSRPLIEKWNGTLWSQVTAPQMGTVETSLLGVAAWGSHGIAVGHYTDTQNNVHPAAEVLHNGAWRLATPPSPASDASLIDVARVPGTDTAWAVGYASNQLETLFEFWNGKQWKRFASPSPGSVYDYIDGIAARSASDVWAVGTMSDGAGQSTLIEHWNGTKWSVVPSPNAGDGANLGGVVATPAMGSQAWAVGAHDDATGASRTLTEQYDGSTWTIVPSVDPKADADFFSGVTVAKPGKTILAAGGYRTNNNRVAHTLIESHP